MFFIDQAIIAARLAINFLQRSTATLVNISDHVLAIAMRIEMRNSKMMLHLCCWKEVLDCIGYQDVVKVEIYRMKLR